MNQSPFLDTVRTELRAHRNSLNTANISGPFLKRADIHSSSLYQRFSKFKNKAYQTTNTSLYKTRDRLPAHYLLP